MIKSLIWNIRSVNTQQAFQRVIILHRQHRFSIIALMEPFQNCRHIQTYRRRLGMEAVLSNINGKIWLFIESGVEWELIMDAEHKVTIKVFHPKISTHIIMTFV